MSWILYCLYCLSLSGTARPPDGREREDGARRRINEYKTQRQSEVSNNSDGGNGDETEYKIYECSYPGSTCGRGDGYGHGELHIMISPQNNVNDNSSGRRVISGCGMRELEYTEITSGYVDPDGNAEWTERTRRRISYNPPGARSDSYNYERYLTYHWGQVNIRCKGKFSMVKTTATI